MKIIVVVGLTILAGCAGTHFETKNYEEGSHQSVVGTVWYYPKADESEFPSPPRSFFKPRALEGAKVALRRFRSREEKAGPLVISARTDNRGMFVLSPPPGTYFLVLKWTGGVITTGYDGKNFETSENIYDFRIVTVPPDTVIVEHFDAHPLVPQ